MCIHTSSYYIWLLNKYNMAYKNSVLFFDLLLSLCFGLNICIPSKYINYTNMMVFEGRPFGAVIGHVGEALMNGISAVIVFQHLDLGFTRLQNYEK